MPAIDEFPGMAKSLVNIFSDFLLNIFNRTLDRNFEQKFPKIPPVFKCLKLL
jgi:hypothetical protein